MHAYIHTHTHKYIHVQVGHGKWQDYDFVVSADSYLNNTNNAKRSNPQPTTLNAKP